MQGRTSREWLVKTALEVRGPYTFEEVVESIKTKEFILVDEVAKSFGRWKLIREETAFEKIVLELQNKTDTSGEKTFTQTETDALTEELSSQVLNFSHKEKLLAGSRHEKNSEGARNRETLNESTKTELSSEIPSQDQISQKVYGVEKNKQINIFSTRRIVRVSVGVMVVIAVSFFFFHKGKEQELSFDQYKQKSIESMETGEFVKAKEYIAIALKIREDNELMFMAATMDLMLGDNSSALKYFEILKSKTKNSQTLSQIYNYLGVINLKNYNLARARLEFETSLEQNPQYVQALYNRGVVDYLENKFESAFQNFSQAMVHGGLDGTILLSVVDVITKGKMELTAENRQTVAYYLSLIQKHIQSFQVFKQELFVASAYVHALLGSDVQEVNRNVKLALDTDPDLTAQHLMDQSLYRGLISWDVLTEWAEKLSSMYPNNDNIKTLLGYTYFKGSDKIKGKEFIEAQLKSDFSNAENQNIYGYILVSLGQDQEAKAALAQTQNNTELVLSKIILAKICLKELDLKCSQKYFEEVLSKEPSNLAALVGLGQVFLNMKMKPKASEYAQKAFKLSSYSKEVQLLKSSVEELP